MSQEKPIRSSQNTRLCPRMDFSETPWIFALVRAAAPDSEQALRMEAKNISRSGVKFLSNFRFSLFSSLDFRLYSRNGKGESFTVSGKVVRLEETDTGHGEKTFGIAVEFHSLESNSAKCLADILPAGSPQTASEDVPAKK